jgi:DNA modification methylase
MKKNKLNDLSGTEWIKFQKSWFIHNPPPRKKGVLQHPAKFPETMVEEFIRFFTKKGMNVLDPMVGTGSTLIACVRSGRNGYGIELNPKYAEIAQKEVNTETSQLQLFEKHPEIQVFNSDANNIHQLNIPSIDYCITSPPYWDMLRMKGSGAQKKRRNNEDLDVYYSDDPKDLG